MSFTFFSKTLDPLVTENGSKQVNVTTQTSFILIVKLTYFRSLARLVCTIFSSILGNYLSLKLSVLITLLSIFHLARISRNENFSVLFLSFEMPKIDKMKHYLLAVTIYIMGASRIRTRTRKLNKENKKWQAGHPCLQKNMWFTVNQCGDFWGEGRRIRQV